MNQALCLLSCILALVSAADENQQRRISLARVESCAPVFKVIGAPADFEKIFKLVKLAPDSPSSDPAAIVEKAELVEKLVQFANSGLLSRSQRTALLGRLENRSYADIASQRAGGISANAVGVASSRAVAKAIHFFKLQNEGLLYLRDRKQDPAVWLRAQMQSREWNVVQLATQAKLSAAEMAMVTKLLSTDAGPLEPLLARYLVGRLAPFFAQHKIEPLTKSPSAQTSLPKATHFIDFLQSENAKRQWDLQTLRFLALERKDVALVKEIMAGSQTLESQIPSTQSRIRILVDRAYDRFPPGSESGAPKQNETIQNWLTRELSSRQYPLDQTEADSPFWTDLKLNIPGNRQEVLRALRGESTEFSVYVRRKLLDLFRRDRPE